MLSFILGGNSATLLSRHEDMSCNATTTDHSAGGFIQAANPINFDEDVTTPDGRRLIVSNCPETWSDEFGASGPVTLYRAHIYLEANVTQPVRLWFWHLGSIEFPTITVNPNTTSQNLRYYLVIGGASDLPASLAQTRIAIAQTQGGN